MASTTDTILMIRPANFGYNIETAASNSFQSAEGAENKKTIADQAKKEFDAMVNSLRQNQVNVIVVDDTEDPKKPDAVFPNNWFSTHAKGILVTYPMFAPSRRIERRDDILDQLESQYDLKKRYSFDYYEGESKYLEGTGSLILDRLNKVCYACLSPRTSIEILNKFGVLMGYKIVHFHAYDNANSLIYHTNVMMHVAQDLAIVCTECITDKKEKQRVIDSLTNTGIEIVPISLKQVESFAGNMLEIKSDLGERLLAMSQTALDSLKASQIKKIEKKCRIVAFDISTIEKYGGGSVRCMMAEIFPKKN